MQTTPDEKQRISEIIQHLVQGDKQWLKDKLILVGDKGNYWILNYLQGPRNEYNGLVRGMVVSKPQPGWHGEPLSLIKSFPFVRFFNQGEKEAAPVNLSNAEMLEKMDGTLVGIFFPDGNPSNPHFHTRKMVSSHQEDMDRMLTSFGGKEYNFMPIIGSFIKKLNFSSADIEYTYVFEFIHEASYVLTKYNPVHYGLYLLGARHLPTHKEMTEQKLDKIAQRIGAKRPRRWDAIASHDEIMALMKNLAQSTPDFEGFVFRDRETGNRQKVKDPDYVEKHYSIDKGRNASAILRAIYKGEEDEIVAYRPHIVSRIDEIKAALAKYIENVAAKVKEWQSKGLKGEQLAYALFGRNLLQKWQLRLMKIRGEKLPEVTPAEPDEFVRAEIMKLQNTPEHAISAKIGDDLKQIALGVGNHTGSPKTVLDMIGLNDKEEEMSDVGEI